MPLPALFGWQALDDGNLLIWPRAGALPHQLVLTHDIDGLASDPPGLLQLIDGDHDGAICSEGFDSVGLWSDAAGDVPVTVGEAEVGFVEALNALALGERLREHATTLGPRVTDRVMDD